jgi:hypothetical protein
MMDSLDIVDDVVTHKTPQKRDRSRVICRMENAKRGKSTRMAYVLYNDWNTRPRDHLVGHLKHVKLT